MMSDAAESRSESSTEVARRPRRLLRWFLRLSLFGLLVLAAGVWFAPQIVSHSSLRPKVIAWALDGQPVKVDFDASDWGWFKPVTAHDVSVLDAQGKPLVKAKEFHSQATLWELIRGWPKLGTFQIVEPVGNVVLRANGSNIEDLIATFPASSSDGPALEFLIEFVNSRIEFEHPAANRKSTLDGIDGKIEFGPSGLTRALAEMPSKSGGGKDDAGQLALYFGELLNDNSNTGGSNSSESDQPMDGVDLLESPSNIQQISATVGGRQLKLRVKEWRLDWLNPILARWHPGGEIAGLLNANFKAALTAHPAEKTERTKVAGRGEFSISNLLVAGLTGMKSDKLRLAEVTLRGQVKTDGRRVQLDDTELKSDIGEMTATGDMPLSGWSFTSPEQAFDKLSAETFRIDGQVDLAKLAALLPRTLAVRDGTKITGGSVKAVLLSQPKDGARRLSGKMEVASLSAIADGQKVDWNVPIEAIVSVRRDQNEFVFDRLTCRSDFLQADATGTLSNANFTATADLDKLHQNLNRFFDWGIDGLSGQLQAGGKIQQRHGGEVALSAKTQLTAFEVRQRGQSPWREQSLDIDLTSTGHLSDQQHAERIDSAELTVMSGGDRFRIKLLEPVDLTAKPANWRGEADLIGGLQSWQSRLQPLISFAGWQLAGQIVAHAEVDAGRQRINVSNFKAAIEQLDAKSTDYAIREPKLSLQMTGQYDVSAERWTSPSFDLVSQTATIHGRDIEATLKSDNLAAKGDTDFRVSLGNVSRWMLAGQVPPNYFLGGDAAGKLTFRQQAGTTVAKLDSQIQKAIVASKTGKPQPAWETVWQEESVRLTGEAAIDPAKQLLKLTDAKITADGLEVACSGTIDEWQAAPRLDLSGDLAYDWDRLMLRLGESVRQNIKLTGRDQRPFALRGSLPSATVASSRVPATAASLHAGRSATSASNDAALLALTGQAGLGWESASLYGLPLSTGNIGCKLQDGVGQLAMSDVSVLEGKVRLASQLRLDQSPFRLDLDNQQVVEQVRLTPELCAGWLKFVAPILADSTRVDGRFSMSVTEGSLPVTDPGAGAASGQFGIHNSQLTPGPFAMQIITLVDQIKVLTKSGSAGDPNKQRVWVTLPEQQVPFRLADGRVHHQGLTMVTKEVTLKTRGSVGLDDSLDLIIDVPVRDEWLNSNKYLAGLRGKALSIPVRGTLSRPQIDNRVFQQLAREATTGAVENLLDQQLQKGLNKLLPGKK